MKSNAAITASAVVLAACAFIGWRAFRTEAPTAGAQQSPVITTTQPAGAESAVSAAAVLPASAPVLEPTGPAASEPATKAALVDYLARTGGPNEKFRAYQVIRRCLNAREQQALVGVRAANGDTRAVPDRNQACGDITSAQVAGRMRLLEQATAAGIRGAAKAFGLEGPGGYGLELDRAPDDAEAAAYREALAKAVDSGAAHGDEWSLMSLSARYEFPDGDTHADNSQALTYLVAANDRYRAGNGSDRKSYEGEVNRLRSKLIPSQAEAAIAAGHKLFATFPTPQ